MVVRARYLPLAGVVRGIVSTENTTSYLGHFLEYILEELSL